VDFGGLGHAPLFTRLGLLIGLLPLLAGLWCAIRPNDRALSLMRPLSLAAIFAAASNVLLGLANALHAFGTPRAGTPHVGILLAEAMIPGFVGFAFLTVAWLCVALAVRRPS